MGNFSQAVISLMFCGTTVHAAQPTSITCRTPLGVPCHTIHYEESRWQLFDKGVTDIRHYTDTRTIAARRDGSMANFVERSSSGLFGGSQAGVFRWIYSAPEDQVIRVFPAEQTFSRRSPVIWHDRPYRYSRDGDTNCASGILHSGTDFREAGWYTVAGVPVVKWTRPNAMNGTDERYLAPSLDCVPLKTYSIYRNRWYVPTCIIATEATSIEIGEPKPDDFEIPAGYRQIEDPSLPRLMQFVERENQFRRGSP